MTTPAGSFSYTYDAVGRMSGLTNPFSETSSWQYLDNGWLWKQTLGNGVVTAYTYNAVGQMTELKTVTGTTTLSDFSGQTFDGVGNRTAMTASLPAAPTAYSGTTSYTYDYGQTANPALNRSQLTQEQSTRNAGYTDAFSYDGGTSTGPGNPTGFKGASHTFNANNQDTANTYDGNGNPTTYHTGSLAFDPENRLTAYGSALTCGYTGDGLRAWKQGTGGKTYFLYDDEQPVCELSSAGAVTATDTFGAAGLLSRNAGGVSVFYTFDPSGGVAQRLSGAGAVLSSDLYDGFGARQSTGGADVFGFGGQWGYYTDAETGLTLCTHRFYDPAAGRWLTRDPIGNAGGVNLYGYCQNNPIGLIDPQGFAPGGSRFGGMSCPDLLRKITNYENRLNDLFNKYNQGTDGKGGFPTGHGGTTAPNFHYDEIKKLQQLLGQALAEYNDRCGPPRVPAVCHRYVPYPAPGGDPGLDTSPSSGWVPIMPTNPIAIPVGVVVGGVILICVLQPELCLPAAVGASL